MCYVSPVWSTGRFMAVLCFFGEKTVYIKANKTAIIRPVDHTGEQREKPQYHESKTKWTKKLNKVLSLLNIEGDRLKVTIK